MCPVVKSISSAEQSCVTGMAVSPLSSEFCTVQLLEGLINLSALQKREASSFQGLFHIMLLTPELQMLHTCDTHGCCIFATKYPSCVYHCVVINLGLSTYIIVQKRQVGGVLVSSDRKFDKGYHTRRFLSNRGGK